MMCWLDLDGACSVWLESSLDSKPYIHLRPTMALTPEVIAAADRIMTSDAAVNLKVLELNDLWLSNGLASKQIHGPEKFCIHPQNRGGSMMNSFDMTTKGKR